ncbi:MAG: RelA/SpoT domain-containing protein [Vampirovibrionales bacterium]
MLYTRSAVKQLGKRFEKATTLKTYMALIPEIQAYRNSFIPAANVVRNRCMRVLKSMMEETPELVPSSDDYIVASRMKRFPSIQYKLKRFPNMGLDTMQDLAGVRVILPNLLAVEEFVKRFPGKRSSIKIKKEFDYILNPKDDGYRSYHLVLDVPRQTLENQPTTTVELQVRTVNQHAWATAVEVAGLTEGKKFKEGQWTKRWAEFFKLAGMALAYDEIFKIFEVQPELKHLMFGYIKTTRFMFTSQELRLEIEKKTKNLKASLEKSYKQIEETATITKDFLDQAFAKKNKYTHICYLSNTKKALLLKEGFIHLQLQEESKRNANVLFLAVDDLKKLTKAYPNYLNDTSVFVNTLKVTIEVLTKESTSHDTH